MLVFARGRAAERRFPGGAWKVLLGEPMAIDREVRVLVVEDNPADALRVQDALKGQDLGAFRTTVVGRMGDAVSRIGETDVVLLDLTLPDGSGIEFLDWVRAKSPSIPVVVLSGRRDREAAFDCLQHGAQEVLLKGSVDGSGLARALRCAVERRALEERRDGANRRVRAAEDNLRNMLGAAREGVLVADPQGRALYANPTAGELLGWPAGGRGDLPVNLPLLSPGPSEVERLGPDGVVRTLEVRIARIRWEGAAAVLATIHDLTPRKRAEAERRRLEERARETEWLGGLGRLAGGVAHRLGNQLTSVLGDASVMMDGSESPDRLQHLAHRMEEAGWRAMDIVNQLLACARRQPQNSPELEPADAVAEFRAEVKDSLRSGMTLRWEMEQGLPKVRIDRRLLGQALSTMVEFCRDSMSDAGELTVRVHQAAGAGAKRRPVVLSVSDSGPELGSESRKRLFEPFYTTDVLGIVTGLGLAPVYGIARQSGGTVEVDSIHGQGTTLRMLLPGIEEGDAGGAVDDGVAGSAAETSAVAGLPRGDETALVVIRDPALLSSVRRALQDLGHGGLRFSRAEEAVRLVSAWKGPMGVPVTGPAGPGT